MAERAGFEPAVLSHTAFRERHHQPLGHLSAREDTKRAWSGRDSDRSAGSDDSHEGLDLVAPDTAYDSNAAWQTGLLGELDDRARRAGVVVRDGIDQGLDIAFHERPHAHR